RRQGDFNVFHLVEAGFVEDFHQSAVVAPIVVRLAPFEFPDEVAHGTGVVKGIYAVRMQVEQVGPAVVVHAEGSVGPPRTGLDLEPVGAVFGRGAVDVGG